MKGKSERALGWLALAGLFLSMLVFLAVYVQSAIAQAKQAGMDQAKASLTAALSDLHSNDGGVFEPKSGHPHGRFYGGIWISPCPKTIVVDGKSYRLALGTADWDPAGFKHDWLAVTTNNDFIWMDHRHGPKLIPSDYKVSRWQMGY